MSVGAFINSNADVTNRDVTSFILPSLLVGLGFAFTLSPMTAVAVNSVPRELTGMASATTNLLRDLGFALGPVLVGAIALSAAGGQLMGSLQTSGLAPDQLGPAMGIAEAGGPIALNSMPRVFPDRAPASSRSKPWAADSPKPSWWSPSQPSPRPCSASSGCTASARPIRRKRQWKPPIPSRPGLSKEAGHFQRDDRLPRIACGRSAGA